MELSLDWDRSTCWLVIDVNGLPNQFPEFTKGSTPLNVLLLGTGAFIAFEALAQTSPSRYGKMDGYSVARPILKTGLISAGVLAMVDGADRKEPGMVAGGAGILALTSVFYPSSSFKTKDDITMLNNFANAVYEQVLELSEFTGYDLDNPSRNLRRS